MQLLKIVGKIICKWIWYETPHDRARFFPDTSLHGLQYLRQRRKNFCERIFWSTAFVTAMIASTMLIWEMWENYVQMPIVTVFNPREKTLHEIPFPAVTICNVNTVKKSVWERQKREAMMGLTGQLPDADRLKALANVHDIFYICNSTKPFTNQFKDALSVPVDEFKDEVNKHFEEYRHLLDPNKTLRNASQSCDEMILFCRWLGKPTICSKLFHEIQTDFGICCTFNMIPLSLLKRSNGNIIEDPQRVQAWRNANLHHDNLVLKKQFQNRQYPYRQLHPGRSAGLSFLVDPALHEYHCTDTDSEGFMVALNLPLDFPRMKDNGNAVRTNSETFISVRPGITMPAKSVRNFALTTRRCYLEGEKKLTHYTKYTLSNCMDECFTKRILDLCGCVLYYMPRVGNETLCETHLYNCTEKVTDQIIRGGLEEGCTECLPSCSEIF